MSHSICTVVINYQTPDLLKIAVESFRKFYPTFDLLIIDNGSKDNSREVIKDLQSKSPLYTKTLFLEENIFHGPAMHHAIKEFNYDYLFFLDSDTETHKGAFLEEMAEILNSSDRVYGTGRFLTLNKRGFQSSKGISIPAPAYMMIKRNLYFQFPPFEHHGMPVLKNFSKALKLGFEFKEFPIENYIEHLWRGTAGRFGYSLGIKAKIDYVLNKLGL
ncbi:MAG: glycosyltransferase family A protein [Ignavibacteria bacterium]|nr:glycosyltransferase family A protein [Ignavibacteria bacterium]